MITLYSPSGKEVKVYSVDARDYLVFGFTENPPHPKPPEPVEEVEEEEKAEEPVESKPQPKAQSKKPTASK